MMTRVQKIGFFAGTGLAIVLALAGAAPPVAPAANVVYAKRAPIADYLMPDQAVEIALARSAAPQLVAKDADVMVFEKTGYRTVAKGTNGFVCMVWRSWADDLGDPQFWNPKVRVPICLNPIAARTVLPDYFKRTGWVLSGLSLGEIKTRFMAAAASGELHLPASGAMSYMMSRQGYLADGIGPAMPHIMFFVPSAEHQQWGANLAGSPVAGAARTTDPVSLFYVSVAKWSDGTPAMAH